MGKKSKIWLIVALNMYVISYIIYMILGDYWPSMFRRIYWIMTNHFLIFNILIFIYKLVKSAPVKAYLKWGFITSFIVRVINEFLSYAGVLTKIWDFILSLIILLLLAIGSFLMYKECKKNPGWMN